MNSYIIIKIRSCANPFSYFSFFLFHLFSLFFKNFSAARIL